MQLNRYKNGVLKKVKLTSFNKYKTLAKGSNACKNKITWYDLTVELPLDTIQGNFKTTISTTNSKVEKYREMEYVDVCIIYKCDGTLIDSVYIKEDLKTPGEKYLSLIFGSISIAIFLIGLFLSLA